MKPSEKRRQVKRAKHIITLLLLIAAIVIWFTSCSALKPTEQRPDFEIEWDGATIVAPDEDLLTPNVKDGKIVGISRNGNKYKIEDGHGHKAGKMQSDIKPDSSMIGTLLICKTR